MKKTARGYTLVEMAVVLVVLGLVAVVAAKLAPRFMAIGKNPTNFEQIASIEDTLTGFVFTHSRLPCPDSNADGIEDCGGGLARGYLPFRTLGMPGQARNSSGLALRYAVFRNSAGNSDLASRVDRFAPLLPAGTAPTAVATVLGVANALDMCKALHSAGLSTVDTNRLFTGSGTDARNVAWVLLDPGAGDADGDGNLLDGANATGTGFERADRAMDAAYDDQVVSMSFVSLWAKLGCAAVFSAVGHGQANAALTAVVMLKSLQDYATQLDIANDLAGADVAAATAGQLSAIAGLAGASADVAIGTAEALESQGGLTAAIGLAAAAVVASTAATVAAAAALASAIAAKVITQSQLNDFNNGIAGKSPMVTQATTLSVSIRQNAVNADAAGLYAQ